MDQVVEDRPALFQKVVDHLEIVKSNASLPLDEELLRRASRNADIHLSKTVLWQVLSSGEETLQTLQQDPGPLTRLLEEVVLALPFDELKSTISTEKLEEGLRSPSAPIQRLIIAYLRKAADLPSGAAFVACSPSLTKVLVTTWLASESTEVADKCLDAITALLDVDNTATSTFIASQTGSGEAYGQGLFWKRLFQDAEIYTLFFEWTSLTHSKHDVSTKKGLHQATTSQGRLFDFLAKIAEIDWSYITTSSLPEVEKQFTRGQSRTQPYGGLLRYAATDMIDSNDYLMELLRQDLFAKLVDTAEQTNNRGVPPRMLEAMQSNTGGNSHNRGENGLFL